MRKILCPRSVLDAKPHCYHKPLSISISSSLLPPLSEYCISLPDDDQGTEPDVITFWMIPGSLREFQPHPNATAFFKPFCFQRRYVMHFMSYVPVHSRPTYCLQPCPKNIEIEAILNSAPVRTFESTLKFFPYRTYTDVSLPDVKRRSF